MVDIIIPSHNRKELLKRAISSVEKQTFKDWFLWIADDGSEDGTAESIKKTFKGKFPFKVISSPRREGVSAARNKGIRQGQREWVAFLDSDDEWLPEKLKIQMDYLKENPAFSFVHSNELWLKRGYPFPQKKKHKKEGGRIFARSTGLCCISPSAVLVRRSLLEEVGLFREDFPVCEDYELWLRITSRFPVGFVEKPLIVKHGGHGDQLSQKYKAMDYWRVKALKPFLQSSLITEEERKIVCKVLIRKCQILLKGYEKYKNLQNKEEVKYILNLTKNTPDLQEGF